MAAAIERFESASGEFREFSRSVIQHIRIVFGEEHQRVGTLDSFLWCQGL
jgi:hypothetical protein